jgi:hypothetical protein
MQANVCCSRVRLWPCSSFARWSLAIGYFRPVTGFKVNIHRRVLCGRINSIKSHRFFSCILWLIGPVHESDFSLVINLASNRWRPVESETSVVYKFVCFLRRPPPKIRVDHPHCQGQRLTPKYKMLTWNWYEDIIRILYFSRHTPNGCKNVQNLFHTTILQSQALQWVKWDGYMRVPGTHRVEQRKEQSCEKLSLRVRSPWNPGKRRMNSIKSSVNTI